MTVRFPEPLHKALRRAAFDTEVPMNTLACEGTVLRLAFLDDTMAKALAEADELNDWTWEGLSKQGKDIYRKQAKKVLELVAGQ